MLDLSCRVHKMVCGQTSPSPFKRFPSFGSYGPPFPKIMNRINSERPVQAPISPAIIGLLSPAILLLQSKLYLEQKISADEIFRSHQLEKENIQLNTKCAQKDLEITSIKCKLSSEENRCERLKAELDVLKSQKSMVVAECSTRNHILALENSKLRSKLRCAHQENNMIRSSAHLLANKINIISMELKEVKNNSIPAKEIGNFNDFTPDNIEINQNLHQYELNIKSKLIERQKIFEEIQDTQGSIRIYCRIKPVFNGQPIFDFPNQCLSSDEISSFAKKYGLHRVFTSSSTQKKVYAETSGVVESVMNGKNVCIFAYGQSGSGKTHTMEGTQIDPGVNCRALGQLFKLIKNRPSISTEVTISMFEIYNNKFYDLLSTPQPSSSRQQKEKNLRLVDISSRSHAFLQNLKTVQVRSLEQAQKVLRSGSHKRSTAATGLNNSSSRSHLIVQITVRSTKIADGSGIKAELHLVDLAGSERSSKSKVTEGAQKESNEINKSLLSLAMTFEQIGKGSKFIPFRNSSLTHYLHSRIRFGSQSLMFVNVSNEVCNKLETTNSLNFARRLSAIKFQTESHRIQTAEKLRGLELSLRNLDSEISSLRSSSYG